VTSSSLGVTSETSLYFSYETDYASHHVLRSIKKRERKNKRERERMKEGGREDHEAIDSLNDLENSFFSLKLIGFIQIFLTLIKKKKLKGMKQKSIFITTK